MRPPLKQAHMYTCNIYVPSIISLYLANNISPSIVVGSWYLRMAISENASCGNPPTATQVNRNNRLVPQPAKSGCAQADWHCRWYTNVPSIISLYLANNNQDKKWITYDNTTSIWACKKQNNHKVIVPQKKALRKPDHSSGVKGRRIPNRGLQGMR